MKYKNTRTGAMIDVQCKMEGAWVPVEKPADKKPKKKKSAGGAKK